VQVSLSQLFDLSHLEIDHTLTNISLTQLCSRSGPYEGALIPIVDIKVKVFLFYENYVQFNSKPNIRFYKSLTTIKQKHFRHPPTASKMLGVVF